MACLTIHKVEYLQVPGGKLPNTLWVGPKGFFSRPLLRVPLALERCSFWPRPRPGEDFFVLTRHQFEGDATFALPTKGHLKVKLLRGRKKVAKVTVPVQDLLARTSSGVATDLHFPAYHPLGHALIKVGHQHQPYPARGTQPNPDQPPKGGGAAGPLGKGE